MRFGVDYAEPPQNPHVLVEHSVKFVCRYLSTPGNPKNLTAQESFSLHALGIGRVVVFETTGKTWRGGHAAGVEDARLAGGQLAALGLAKAPVYFAVDEDVQLADLPTVLAYIEGCVSVLGWQRVGVYGSYAVVDYVAAHKACRYFWQTYAWSHGAWHPAAHLRQYQNGQRYAGLVCDFDTATTRDFGQVEAPVLRPVSNAVRRAHLRAWILAQHRKRLPWGRIFKTSQWKLFRRLGGK